VRKRQLSLVDEKYVDHTGPRTVASDMASRSTAQLYAPSPSHHLMRRECANYTTVFSSGKSNSISCMITQRDTAYAFPPVQPNEYKRELYHTLMSELHPALTGAGSVKRCCTFRTLRRYNGLESLSRRETGNPSSSAMCAVWC